MRITVDVCISISLYNKYNYLADFNPRFDIQVCLIISSLKIDLYIIIWILKHDTFEVFHLLSFDPFLMTSDGKGSNENYSNCQLEPIDHLKTF